MLLATQENPYEFLEVWASPSILVHGGLDIHDVISILQAYSKKEKKKKKKKKKRKKEKRNYQQKAELSFNCKMYLKCILISVGGSSTWLESRGVLYQILGGRLKLVASWYVFLSIRNGFMVYVLISHLASWYFGFIYFPYGMKR